MRVTGLGVAREQRVEHVGAQGRLLRQLEYERLVDDQHAVAIQLVGANGPAALDHTKGLERDPHGPGARSLKAQIEGCEPERGAAPAQCCSGAVLLAVLPGAARSHARRP